MRRAAVSIPSNIAEGQARHTTGEFIQFISHGEGSVAELETQIILAVELEFCAKNAVLSAVNARRDSSNAKRTASKTRDASVTGHRSLSHVILIKDGEIVTGTEHYIADIFCENERITHIDRNIDAPPAARK